MPTTPGVVQLSIWIKYPICQATETPLTYLRGWEAIGFNTFHTDARKREMAVVLTLVVFLSAALGLRLGFNNLLDNGCT